MALESRRGFVPERIPAWVDVWTYGNMSIGRNRRLHAGPEELVFLRGEVGADELALDAVHMSRPRHAAADENADFFDIREREQEFAALTRNPARWWAVRVVRHNLSRAPSPACAGPQVASLKVRPR